LNRVANFLDIHDAAQATMIEYMKLLCDDLFVLLLLERP